MVYLLLGDATPRLPREQATSVENHWVNDKEHSVLRGFHSQVGALVLGQKHGTARFLCRLIKLEIFGQDKTIPSRNPMRESETWM